eukprot:TRINITY_DN2869_c1_g2_i2.p1 TRINITY_DN2869_c1_g2~~TRINITY_DN2869_c1_g2_i2.p1  ORF type:complete len:1920 (-),score=496.80 TRINITY_DN2869_c1_g2_i2:51-5636(-)
MTRLAELHEATLLWTLKERYMNNDIYTYIGPMIISVNPFQGLPLYTKEKLIEYQTKPLESLPPHPFVIAQKAFKALTSGGNSQSVIISGESGAGKTEATKVVLRYLTDISAKYSRSASCLDLASRILATNPVLESFGNAKTTKNNNSSRFGKFIKIEFLDSKIVGASIDNYLLEKTRIVYQAPQERNYHIFYQFIKGCSPEERQKYKVLSDPAHYQYLVNGDVVIPGVDDAREFQLVKRAMLTLGFSEVERDNIFKLLSIILSLGNITFYPIEGTDNVRLDPLDPAVGIVSSLLEVGKEELMKRLTFRLFSRGGTAHASVFEVPFKEAEAKENRDGMAKALYSSLFNNLVAKLNEHLSQATPGSEGKILNTKFIGVLDIYGFEKFEKNSLEQFNINYANEKLHHQFNEHLFKAEQEEYTREGIPWNTINYSDNSNCIDLIEKHILTTLDEEARVPQGSDRTFQQKVVRDPNVTGNTAFYYQPQFTSTLFGIKHYADNVIYTVDGFMDKNKDKITEDVVQLVMSSENPYYQGLIDKVAPTGGGGRNRARVQPESVTKQFKNSLVRLMTLLESSERHYIRCIKPNDVAKPSLFVGSKVLAQLRSNGVMETVKLRKVGFGHRLLFDMFCRRYSVLAGGNSLKNNPPKQIIQQFLTYHVPGGKDAFVGATKVFLNESASELLNKKLSFALKASTTIIQKHVRTMWGCVNAKKLRDNRQAVLTMQRFARRFLAARTLLQNWSISQVQKKQKAAIVLQQHIRVCSAQTKLGFLKFKEEERKRKEEEEHRKREEEIRQREEEKRRREEEENRKLSPESPRRHLSRRKGGDLRKSQGFGSEEEIGSEEGRGEAKGEGRGEGREGRRRVGIGASGTRINSLSLDSEEEKEGSNRSSLEVPGRVGRRMGMAGGGLRNSLGLSSEEENDGERVRRVGRGGGLRASIGLESGEEEGRGEGRGETRGEGRVEGGRRAVRGLRMSQRLDERAFENEEIEEAERGYTNQERGYTSQEREERGYTSQERGERGRTTQERGERGYTSQEEAYRIEEMERGRTTQERGERGYTSQEEAYRIEEMERGKNLAHPNYAREEEQETRPTNRKLNAIAHQPKRISGIRKREALVRTETNPSVRRSVGPRNTAPHEHDVEGRIIFRDDDDIEYVLMELCKEAGITRLPKPEHYELLREDCVENFGHVRRLDEKTFEILSLRGLPVMYRRLLEESIQVAQAQKFQPVPVPAPSHVTQEYVSDGRGSQPQESAWGSFFKGLFNEEPVPEPSAFTPIPPKNSEPRISNNNKNNNGQGNFQAQASRVAPLHPLGTLAFPPTPLEEREAEFLFGLSIQQVLSGDYYIDESNANLAVTLCALSLQVAFPDTKDVLGKRLFRPDQHLPPQFQRSARVVATACEIHNNLTGMTVEEAMIQYIRQLEPLPMFYWTVADQDEEGQLIFWRVAFDETCFYRFDYDGDDLIDEPSASAPYANITRIRNMDNTLSIHMSGPDLPPVISFMYETAEAGIEISRVFTYYVEKTQMELASRASSSSFQAPPSSRQQEPAFGDDDDDGSEFVFEKIETFEIKVHVGRGNPHVFVDLDLKDTVQAAANKIARKMGLAQDGRYGLRTMRSPEFLNPKGNLKSSLPAALKPGSPVDIRLGIRIFVRNSPSKSYTGPDGQKIMKFDFEEFSTRVSSGDWEMRRESAVKLAALHFQTIFPGQTDFINPISLPPDSLQFYMGEPWRSSRNIIQLVCDEFATLTNLTPDQAMRKYIEIVNNLESFGSVAFHVRSPRGNEILCVNGDGLTQIDANSHTVMASWPYSDLAGWNARDELLQVKVATGVLKWIGPDVHAIVALLSEHVAFKLQEPPKKQQPTQEKEEECLIM